MADSFQKSTHIIGIYTEILLGKWMKLVSYRIISGEFGFKVHRNQRKTALKSLSERLSYGVDNGTLPRAKNSPPDCFLTPFRVQLCAGFHKRKAPARGAFLLWGG